MREDTHTLVTEQVQEVPECEEEECDRHKKIVMVVQHSPPAPDQDEDPGGNEDRHHIRKTVEKRIVEAAQDVKACNYGERYNRYENVLLPGSWQCADKIIALRLFRVTEKLSHFFVLTSLRVSQCALNIEKKKPLNQRRPTIIHKETRLIVIFQHEFSQSGREHSKKLHRRMPHNKNKRLKALRRSLYGPLRE